MLRPPPRYQPDPALRDELDPLAVRARQAGVAVEQVSDRLMERLTSTVTPQGVVGIAPFVDVGIDDLSPPGAVAVLHEVRDPGNAGTILRSADAAGAAGVVFAGSSVDAYNPKSVRASAGSIFHVPVVRNVATEDALASLRAKGFARVWAQAPATRCRPSLPRRAKTSLEPMR